MLKGLLRALCCSAFVFFTACTFNPVVDHSTTPATDMQHRQAMSEKNNVSETKQPSKKQPQAAKTPSGASTTAPVTSEASQTTPTGNKTQENAEAGGEKTSQPEQASQTQETKEQPKTAQQETASEKKKETAGTSKQNKNEKLKREHPLHPFSESFRIYISKIPLPIKAELTLKKGKQSDTWKMRFYVHSFLMHNLEESTFKWNDCHPKSIHYKHELKAFGHHQHHNTDFYWNPPHVVNHSKGDDKSFTIPANSVDDLTLLLQAACYFSEGHTDYYATSVYGDEIRHNHFKLVRHEKLKTPLGKLKTLVVEKVRKHDNGRHTYFWIAPSLNYMLVKARHKANSVLYGDAKMRKYSGPTNTGK